MKIEIDDEVLAFLKSKAEPFVDTPNDVLRRLLLHDSAGTASLVAGTALTERKPRMKPGPLLKPPLGRRPGALIRLIEEGLIKEDDLLTHRRKRAGLTFLARVTDDGWVKISSGDEFSSPSPALKACVGTEIDGWAFWRHDPTGKSLRELRDELPE
jgi:Restriction Enzyme Adenine Methylase Associated